MPINKIAPTKRGKAAIATVLAGIAAGSYAAYDRYATYGKMDPAVIVSVEKAIIPWEGLVLKSHWDPFAKIWDICYGETKGIGPGMTKTRAECKDMLLRRVHDDYYQVIVQCSPNLSKSPISVRASMISGSYNFGVGAWCRSTAKARIEAGQWRAACEAQTAFNRAGGQIVRGLVNRREMGDAQRIGEAELCVSGL
ncbi:GH24 family phage-related lysozyme (muramidase) [Rhizobium skierniewicense]|uniref:Lysozyme n=1 Tax=Rhizobium skierniewicense TaxID=984260 RepID=A0A7W6CA66_9HYPH|nr:lysozyme [Rhizobium skierniewicense]MBB3944715.1 GH24 family phage-related lysozyme (muramidase) [Rhizobium skierniewicense]